MGDNNTNTNTNNRNNYQGGRGRNNQGYNNTGRGNNNYNRRNKSYNSHKKDYKKNNYKYTDTSFKGKTEALEGWYYDAVQTNQAELYNRTTEEILDYIARNGKLGPKVKQSLQDGKEIKLARPQKPKADTDDVDKDIYKEEVKLIVRDTKELKQQLQQSHNIIKGQYTPVMI